MVRSRRREGQKEMGMVGSPVRRMGHLMEKKM